METCDLMAELRKRRLEDRRMLKIVVKEKTERTYRKKFDFDEIIYFCKLLNVSIERFLYGILQISVSDYEKFLRGSTIYVTSERFNEEKVKYLKSVQKQFNKKINWNIRNYYDRNEIYNVSSKWHINSIDFSNSILNKSSACTRRVLNDENCQKRLYIGKYVSVRLPEEYVNKNIKKLTSIANSVMYRIMFRLGIKLSKFDLEDEYQDSLIYMNFNCNFLDKKNKAVISTAAYKESHHKILYNKLFYYKLSKFSKKIREHNYEYIENLRCEKNESFEAVSDIICSLANDKQEVRILKLLFEGYTKEEIIFSENITSIEYDLILANIKKELSKEYNVKI